MRRLRFLPLAGFGLLVACGGATESQSSEAGTGPDAGSRKDAREGPDAVVPMDAVMEAETVSDGAPTTLPLDKPCASAGGQTGQDILDALRPSYSATFTPAATGTATALTIQTSYTGGQAACQPPRCDECPPGWVQIDVQIHFATADGLFDEVFTTPVELSAGSTAVMWDAPVPAMDIKGTYVPTLTGKTVDLSFGGAFTGSTTNGVVEQQAMTGAMGRVAPAGTWK